MRKTYRFLSVFLCVTLLCLSLFVPNISATTQGRITGDGVRLRSDTKTDSLDNVITSFSIGTVVQINGTVKDLDDNLWYNVTYNGKTGYVYGMYVEKINPAPYDPDFENNLKNFPESYRDKLRAIHNTYPNWVFIADNLDITLDEAINLEYNSDDVTKTRKWVELNYGLEWRDSRSGDTVLETRWTYASREAIAYFMDPRNALTVTNSKSSFPNIFTFLQQSCDEKTQNEEGLRTIVKGTFLENGYDDDKDAYIKDIMLSAKESGVSPYIISTTIITEQGVDGTSSLISGTYTGYEGYYNFFNYGATGNDVVKNGLEYAKSAEWNSRSASILGGAKLYESGYLSVDQDTYYYMDFNVKYPKKIWHQYANSLYDQSVKANGIKKAYTANANATLTFKIPVYSSIPDTVYAVPTIENYTPPENTTPETPTPPARKKGDVSGDGQVTVKDFAEIRMHLLGVKTLTGEDLAAADVNSDNSVTVKDFAMVRMYLLGLISL